MIEIRSMCKVVPVDALAQEREHFSHVGASQTAEFPPRRARSIHESHSALVTLVRYREPGLVVRDGDCLECQIVHPRQRAKVPDSADSMTSRIAFESIGFIQL